jgi:antitoxin (DNA-binding transcriptional repressor) of toxin-antitoxin stability system
MEYTAEAAVGRHVMAIHGTKEYRHDMAAIHEHVVNTGEETVITRDGKPYVKIVPASQESTLSRLEREGRVSRSEAGRRQRRPIEPIDAGGDDTTSVVAAARR